ncbi:hypothetical protein FRC10_006850 [Ceratobasidium sp. 414]|nr:hypothetical protein FRC10_006850 [Ceratobasidium sp. 414]
MEPDEPASKKLRRYKFLHLSIRKNQAEAPNDRRPPNALPSTTNHHTRAAGSWSQLRWYFKQPTPWSL